MKDFFIWLERRDPFLRDVLIFIVFGFCTILSFFLIINYPLVVLGTWTVTLIAVIFHRVRQYMTEEKYTATILTGPIKPKKPELFIKEGDK